MIDKNICVRLERDEKQIERSKNKLHDLQPFIKEKSGVFNLLGNEVRLSIIFLLLKEKQLCVCDLSDILEMKVPAISQHLRKLKDRNVVFSTRNGTVIYYEIADDMIPFMSIIFDTNKESINEKIHQ